MEPLKISACFIVKDEERFLERALRSIRPYVAEIVVLDTGSGDASVSIAERYADAIGHFEWVGDFSAARNACAALASHDWIFSMDADEEVEIFDETGVFKALADNPHSIGRYRVRNLAESAESSALAAVTRVYDRRYFRFEGTVHETLAPIRENTGRALFSVPAVLTHYGYSSDVAKSKNKTGRNRELLLRELERNPSDAYYRYQLGKNYSFAGEKERACEAFERVLRLESDTRKEYVADLVECYGNALLELRRYGEATELLRYEGVMRSPRNQFSFGMINMNAGRFDEAVACFKRCIVNGSAEPIESSMPRYNMGVIYECTGRLDEARGLYAACGDFLPAQARLRALS